MNISLNKRRISYFENINTGKLISVWWDGNLKQWIVGMQGTSEWFTYKDKNKVKQKVEELITL